MWYTPASPYRNRIFHFVSPLFRLSFQTRFGTIGGYMIILRGFYSR